MWVLLGALVPFVGLRLPIPVCGSYRDNRTPVCGLPFFVWVFLFLAGRKVRPFPFVGRKAMAVFPFVGCFFFGVGLSVCGWF